MHQVFDVRAAAKFVTFGEFRFRAGFNRARENEMRVLDFFKNSGQRAANRKLIFARRAVKIAEHSEQQTIGWQFQFGAQIFAGRRQTVCINAVINNRKIAAHVELFGFCEPNEHFAADRDVRRGARNQEFERAAIFFVRDKTVKTQYDFGVCAARGEIGVQAFDGLVRVNDLDFALFDCAAQLPNHERIERQTSLQSDEIVCRTFKIRFERAAARGDKREIDFAGAGVAANVERQHFRAAAIERIEQVKHI